MLTHRAAGCTCTPSLLRNFRMLVLKTSSFIITSVLHLAQVHFSSDINQSPGKNLPITGSGQNSNQQLTTTSSRNSEAESARFWDNRCSMELDCRWHHRTVAGSEHRNRFVFLLKVSLGEIARTYRTREEFVPHCSDGCRCAVRWEQWAVIPLMWKELLRARNVSRRN